MSSGAEAGGRNPEFPQKRPDSEFILKTMGPTRYARGTRDRVLGTIDEWAELGPVGWTDPPDVLCRLNMIAWGIKELPTGDFVARLKDIAGGRLELIWHGPSGRWTIWEMVRPGVVYKHDILRLQATVPAGQEPNERYLANLKMRLK